MENQDAVGVSLQFGEFCNSLNLLFLVNDNMAYQKGGGGGGEGGSPQITICVCATHENGYDFHADLVWNGAYILPDGLKIEDSFCRKSTGTPSCPFLFVRVFSYRHLLCKRLTFEYMKLQLVCICVF